VVGLFGGVYWRLVNTFLVGASFVFSCVWCHLELSRVLRWLIHRFTPASLLVRSCILFLNSVS